MNQSIDQSLFSFAEKSQEYGGLRFQSDIKKQEKQYRSNGQLELEKQRNKENIKEADQIYRDSQLKDKKIIESQKQRVRIQSQFGEQQLIKIIWNPSITSKAIKLQNNNSTAILDQQNYVFRSSLASCGFGSGIHYWQVQTDPMTQNQFKVGVSGNNGFDLDSAFCDYKFGWAYYGLGQLRHNSNASGPKYGLKCKNSGTIGVYLNMQKGILAFSLDGKSMGIAFIQEDLKKGPLYPAVSLLHTSGCTIRGQLPVPKIFENPSQIICDPSIMIPQPKPYNKAVSGFINRLRQAIIPSRQSNQKPQRPRPIRKYSQLQKPLLSQNQREPIQINRQQQQPFLLQLSVKSLFQHIINQIIIKKSIPTLQQQSKPMIQLLNTVNLIIKSKRIPVRSLAEAITQVGEERQQFFTSEQQQEAYQLLYNYIMFNVFNWKLSKRIKQDNEQARKDALIKKLQKIEKILRKQE